MYEEAFKAIQGLMKSGVIDWIRFQKNGKIHIKFKIEPNKIIFDKNTPTVEILEFIEIYEK